MQGATLEELRELSRRSRRTQRIAFLALLAVLVMVPAALVAQAWLAPSVAATAVVVLGGALLLWYAYVAGQERGAYRKVFARLQEARRTRTLVPDAPAAPLVQKK